MKPIFGVLVTGSLWILAGCGANAPALETRGPQTLPGVRNAALRAASEQYGVPLDLLMALGYQQGRFEAADLHAPAEAPVPTGKWALLENVTPEEAKSSTFQDDGNASDSHFHNETFGLMHLDAQQLREGAQRVGRSEQDVATSHAANIEAAAALLREYAGTAPGVAPYSDDAFLYAALKLAGVEGDGDAANLARGELQTLRRFGFEVTTQDGERLVIVGEPRPLQTRQALTAGAYPPIEFIPAATSNYNTTRRGEIVRYVVIHDMEGTLASMIAVFKTVGRQASAHYGIRASDGHIVQMVNEADTAWHGGHSYFNATSIGIEHEGYADSVDGRNDNYSKQYPVSSQLVCAIAKKYNIPIDRKHIFGHGNIPSATASRELCSDDRAFVNRTGGCGGGSAHHDPGRYWDFTKYMDMVAKCVAEASTPVTGGTDAGTQMPPVTEMDAGTGTPVNPGGGISEGTGSNNPETQSPVIPSTPSGVEDSKAPQMPPAMGGCTAAAAPVSLLALFGFALAALRGRRRR